jgi:hypothetical protein
MSDIIIVAKHFGASSIKSRDINLIGKVYKKGRISMGR